MAGLLGKLIEYFGGSGVANIPNPTRAWPEVEIGPILLDGDGMKVNSVALGDAFESLEVFGKASRFETVEDHTWILSYQASGLVVSCVNQRITHVTVYTSADTEDRMQGCPSLTLCRNGAQMIVREDSTSDDLMEKFGPPEDAAIYEEEEGADGPFDLFWEVPQGRLTAEYQSPT